jgi:hypothetical protein
MELFVASWCTFTDVESSAYTSASYNPSSHRAAYILASTPFFAQREKRTYTTCQFSNPLGRSRHEQSFLQRYISASNNGRLSISIFPHCFGSSSAIRLCCLSFSFILQCKHTLNVQNIIHRVLYSCQLDNICIKCSNE